MSKQLNVLHELNDHEIYYPVISHDEDEKTVYISIETVPVIGWYIETNFTDETILDEKITAITASLIKEEINAVFTPDYNNWYLQNQDLTGKGEESLKEVLAKLAKERHQKQYQGYHYQIQ